MNGRSVRTSARAAASTSRGPDRTLQEFSYSYVVRTTEPSIKGLTLAEPTRIPPSVFGEIIKLSNLSVLSTTANHACIRAVNEARRSSRRLGGDAERATAQLRYPAGWNRTARRCVAQGSKQS